MKIFGIDLGTTNSCIACVNEYGEAEIISNERNDRTTASVVWFEGGKVVVGQEAKEMAAVRPETVCGFVKRHMGEDEYFFECEGKKYSAPEISSFILRKLVQDASRKLGEEIRDVVITCPAYFFVKERNATKLAGELAGLNVLQIVNEPTAAAIAYGFAQNEKEQNRTIMVYDLGGGTFDVTIIRTNSEEIEVLCTDGDHRLGGKDWDDRLVQMITAKFREESGSTCDPLESPEAVQDLLAIAENAKKQLSSKQSTPIRFSHEGETAKFTLTRDEFEQQTSDLLERTLRFAHSVFELARKQRVETLDDILLVGGSSRMPQVVDRLRSEFSCEPKIYDPDEAVAKGAAIIGNRIRLRKLVDEKLNSDPARKTELSLDTASETEKRKAYLEVAEDYGYTLETVQSSMRRISNVASKSFGIIAIFGENDDNERISNIIYRNTKLPAEAKDVFYTMSDRQTSVALRIMENSAEKPAAISKEVRDGLPLGDGTLLWEGELQASLQGLPKGSPIEVTFRLDADGLLTLIAVEPKSGNRLEHSLMTEALNEKSLQAQARRCRDLTVE